MWRGHLCYTYYVMARYKPAGTHKPKVSSARGIVPCLFVLLLGFALVFYLFYAVLNSSK